ncbi:MAG: isocitrate lyase/phosphoenolpyruvate mutase family protein [Chloroflexi bacterium]|nr:isocitrate lyase/phosphoenolpyruvate mutase family protein [Chloroflexota bacterium]
MPEVSADLIAATNEKCRRLRDLLQAPEILIMPGAFNVLSALLFQHLGFKAVQGSSSAIANASGRPDRNVGRERTVALMSEIAGAVDVPVNADGEDGFGGPDEVRETVRAFVAGGVVGMNMEDGVHGDDGLSLLPLEGQLEKIAAFMDARRELGSEFLLNARTDAFLALRDDPPAALAEAVRRGQAYAEAGAECVFTWGITDSETIRTFAAEVPAPVSVIAGPGSPSVPELQELGVARVSFGSMFLFAAVGGVKKLSEELLGPGTMTSLEDGLSRGEMRALIESRRG